VDRLFVYGTLRRGAENEFARLLEKSARFLSQACIRGRLFRVAHYPGLAAPEDRNDWVKGDVFDGVTAEMLQRLDDYEGPEYSRQLAEVTLEGGGSIAAYLYLYVLPTEGLELIPSGDWNAFISKSSPPE
jgi:gamma-glutamylcyclotransferase (GGCT)/AIG2-like uncharacterized protein YtfP